MSRLTLEILMLAGFIGATAMQIGIGAALVLIGVLVSGVVLGLGLTWLMGRMGR